MKLNILISSPSLEPKISGVSYRYRNIISQLAKNHNLVVVGYDNNFDTHLPSNVISYYFHNIMTPSDQYQRMFNLFLTYYYFFKVYTIIKKHNIDIIHLAGPDTSSILWVELCNILNIKLVCCHHTDLISYMDTRNILLNNILVKYIIKRNDEYIFDNSDAIFMMSDMHIERLVNKHNYRLSINKTSVLSVGIDTDIFKLYPESDLIGDIKNLWTKNTLKLLLISRISLEKNIYFVIDIVKNMKNVSLVLIGYGPEEEKLQNYIKMMSNIKFIGKIRHTDLGRYYSSADIFIQPTNNETLGFTVIESLACGTPVIACRDCTPFITNTYNGFLYNYNNITELTNILNVVYHLDIYQKEKYIENCLEYSEQFKWENTIIQLENKYHSILKEPKKFRYTYFILYNLLTIYLLISFLFILYKV